MVIGSFNIITDPNFPPTVVSQEAINTNPEGIKILNPNLSLVKSQSVKYAAVKDVVNYTIIAKNNNDVTADNLPLSSVIVKDILSSELRFVPKTLKVNGVLNTEANIIDGVSLDTLQAGESKTITFDVEVIDANIMPIDNRASAQFNFQLEPNVPTQIGTTTSNLVELIVKNPNLKIEKTVDKSIASLKDELTYTVTIINNGDLDAINVLFKDYVEDLVTLVDGSFSINGKVVNSVELSKGVTIGNILVNETVIVQYKVVVNGTDCGGKIENKVNVYFGYKFQDGTTGSRERESEKNIVVVNITSFKQITVDEYLKIPTQKPDIEQINNISGKVKILNCHVIKTTKAVSIEGQGLSGYKLVVHAELKQMVEYTAKDSTQSIHVAHYDIPFSTFIVLPESYRVGSKVEVNGILEDVFFNVIDERNFFKNATVLLTAKILTS